MITIAIDNLIYNLKNKDYKKLNKLENNNDFDCQFDNKELEDFLIYITLNFKL